MKRGDTIKEKCAFCGEEHEFYVETIRKDWGKANCVIVNQGDCKAPLGPIWCQWVDLR